jgi:hypothetical protein
VICLPLILVLSAKSVGQSDETAKASESLPDYSSYKQSYHVPFSNKVNFKHLLGMHVRASLNGGAPTTFLVDTGSVGIIVSADEIPSIDPKALAGSMVYSSSGIELDGVWTTTTVTFPDSKDAYGRVATAVVPVLAVKSEKFRGTGVNAATGTPSAHPHPHMFGVGFGRGLEAHPERNPFLNLIEMQAGKMRRGYTITRNGISLGLTAPTTGPGYVFQRLKARTVSAETSAMKPGLKDWETTPGSVTVGSVTSPMGAILMDTGLTNMFFAMPDAPNAVPEGDVPSGTDVTLNLLSGRLHSSFKVGDTSNPVTPRRVTRTKLVHGVTVNTGLRALSAFDYLYDADGGYLGLRPVTDR